MQQIICNTTIQKLHLPEQKTVVHEKHCKSKMSIHKHLNGI